jgi:hypothetical protein
MGGTASRRPRPPEADRDRWKKTATNPVNIARPRPAAATAGRFANNHGLVLLRSAGVVAK